MIKTTTKSNLEKLAKILPYPGTELTLLELALTHKSIGQPNNERLEFLGDSILSFVISTTLFADFAEANEGELTRARAKLVCGDTLAKIAKAKNIGDYLNLGVGERKSGGHKCSSILADGLEAIIGAIYCSSGLQVATEVILGWFSEFIDEVKQSKVVTKDPKTQLQEILQARNLSLPEYEVLKITGSQHQQTFLVSCKTELMADSVVGTGVSRRKAEQHAAQQVLLRLNENNNE